MRTITDQLGRSISYDFPPKRIISFAPAITDTLFSLQLHEHIVGRTRFCIHPKEKVETAINVGGTKDMKIERIHELQPDLIIAEKEENTKEMVEELEKFYPVYVFEIQTVNDALNMILNLGTLTNRIEKARALHRTITTAMEHIPTKYKGKRVAYVIWKNPYMVVGKNTYIQSLMEKLGFINPFTQFEGRYPTVTESDFCHANLDYILLATEPYSFKEKNINEFLNISPLSQPVIVNGEMFWYGVKMFDAVTYFNEQFLR